MLFEEAAKVEPNDWSAHGYLAEMLLESPNWRGAYAHLVTMEEAEPDSVVGNYLMARFWYLSQDFVQARDYAERARSLRPANAELRNLLGQIYLQLEMSSDALNEFEEAVRLAPNQREYQESLRSLKKRLAQSSH